MPLLEAVPFARLDQPAEDEDPPLVDIVVPVYNEARVLEASVRSLLDHLDTEFPLATTVTIADNASTDETWPLAEQLRARWPRVQTLHLDQKGRGRALRAAWSASPSPVVAYVDVDLSTDLHALLPLVAPLLVRSLRHRHRVPVGRRGARGARGQARAHFSVVQRHRPGCAPYPIHRRPVRIQGATGRRGPGPAAVGGERQLVLRYRVARAGRAPRAADPRGLGRLGRGP